MLPEKFRRQLRQEAEQWWKEGLIDANLYQQLFDRYQLNQLERDASQRFVAILLGLGSILLGIAAITFVAANWQVWSRLVKLSLLLILFLGINVAGFYLWQRPAWRKGQRLGEGLLLLGGLLLGANLALLSQMFHQSGNSYELFLVWGLGVVLMAYSLRLTSLGVLAWVLLTISYWLGWLVQWSGDIDSAWIGMVYHMPLVAMGLLMPLAYRNRSKVLFCLASLLVIGSLSLNCLRLWEIQAMSQGWLIMFACVLPPALMWSYSRRLWQFGRIDSARDPFQPLARSLALWFLAMPLYFLSFKGWWSISNSSYQTWSWQPLIDVVILLAITILGWLQLRHDWQWRQDWHLPQERALNSGTFGILLLLTGGMLLWHSEVSQIEVLATLIVNIMLFLLAGGLIRDGLALGNRGMFWGGMVLLVLGIITRVLEYQTGLLLKSLVFAACGVGVIVAGLWFERRIKPTAQPLLSASSTTQEEL